MPIINTINDYFDIGMPILIRPLLLQASLTENEHIIALDKDSNKTDREKMISIYHEFRHLDRLYNYGRLDGWCSEANGLMTNRREMEIEKESQEAYNQNILAMRILRKRLKTAKIIDGDEYHEIYAMKS